MVRSAVPPEQLLGRQLAVPILVERLERSLASGDGLFACQPTVVVRTESGPAGETVAFVIEDTGPEDRELESWRSAPLRGRALACALGSCILGRLGGQIDVARAGDRTRVTAKVTKESGG